MALYRYRTRYSSIELYRYDTMVPYRYQSGRIKSPECNQEVEPNFTGRQEMVESGTYDTIRLRAYICSKWFLFFVLVNWRVQIIIFFEFPALRLFFTHCRMHKTGSSGIIFDNRGAALRMSHAFQRISNAYCNYTVMKNTSTLSLCCQRNCIFKVWHSVKIDALYWFV